MVSVWLSLQCWPSPPHGALLPPPPRAQPCCCYHSLLESRWCRCGCRCQCWLSPSHGALLPSPTFITHSHDHKVYRQAISTWPHIITQGPHPHPQRLIFPIAHTSPRSFPTSRAVIADILSYGLGRRANQPDKITNTRPTRTIPQTHLACRLHSHRSAPLQASAINLTWLDLCHRLHHITLPFLITEEVPLRRSNKRFEHRTM